MKTRLELKCYIEYLHTLAGIILKDKEEEGEENEWSLPQTADNLGSVSWEIVSTVIKRAIGAQSAIYIVSISTTCIRI